MLFDLIDVIGGQGVNGRIDVAKAPFVGGSFAVQGTNTFCPHHYQRLCSVGRYDRLIRIACLLYALTENIRKSFVKRKYIRGCPVAEAELDSVGSARCECEMIVRCYLGAFHGGIDRVKLPVKQVVVDA